MSGVSKKKIGDTSDFFFLMCQNPSFLSTIRNAMYFHHPGKLSNKVPIILCFK